MALVFSAERRDEGTNGKYVLDSFADAFSIALAAETEGAVVTGDPEFQAVESLISVVWLSRRR